MTSFHFWTKCQNRYRRYVHRLFFRRSVPIRADFPLISFTFDDFPQSALLTGGAILKRHGVAGTYYASFGLMGKDGPVGPMFCPEDLNTLLEHGHELGCHTFDHCHSWQTKPAAFDGSILKNRMALREILPEASFRTFSYPISAPRPRSKQAASKYFACCRGGGQAFNAKSADLNNLNGFFLEQSRENPGAVRTLIDQNRRARGWLIFATHDVRPVPSRFGCTPGFFEDIVQYAVSSGTRVLPVIQAWEALCPFFSS